MTTPLPPDYVVMGRVGRPYGVRGFVHVSSFTVPVDNLLAYTPWLLVQHNHQTTVQLETGKTHGQGLIVKWQQCDTREAAAQHTNDQILIPRATLPPLTSQEYYWVDLIGLTVQTISGRELGQIQSLFATGANDVIVVKNDAGIEQLVPYIRHVIKSVDLTKKIMIVDWDLDPS